MSGPSPIPGDPCWLDAAQQQAWRNLAGVLIKLPAALEADMQRKAGISHFEYFVLAQLSEAPDRTLPMNELAALSSSSASRLSHVARRLEGRGWISRASSQQDGRYTNATLTDAGLDKVVATAPGHVQTVRSLVVDALSDAELHQLDSIAQRILDRVDPTGDCAC
ncbi:MAG: MarR family winged helix-turn-helix transcriptional regulator [Pseudonocardiaceae bacterium]